MSIDFASQRKNGRFLNVPPRSMAPLSEFIKWARRRDRGGWNPRGADYAIGAPPPARVAPDAARVTFVNHATVLLQLAGLNILTDPIWGERASPVPFAGPRRARPAGIAFDDLPPIDLILLSHNHYDHLCIDTLRRLARRDRPKLITGLGNSPVPRRAGLTSIRELDWWEQTTEGGIEITYVPAQHFSGRGLFDRFKALWGGFYLRLPAGAVYFAADSGAGPHFEAIRRRLGAPDFAMIPIGAYRPRAIMQPVHISPREAVEVHQTIGARESMAIHFGTFPLADDGQYEPAEKLEAALHEAGLSQADFWVPAFGEGREIRLTAA
ncbi:MAG: MBL fold metallo-hydrolase [Rhodothermales bacterium]